MPFLHIKSLPPSSSFQAAAAVEAVSREFAQEAQVSLEHVTVTWEVLGAGHYAVGGQARMRQTRQSHPVLVDLLAPDFNEGKQRERMLRAAARAVARQARVPLRNVFVNFRAAHSGAVFDAGRIVRW